MSSKEKNKNQKVRHIFVVSDATGSTCEIVVKAALSQFSMIDTTLHTIRYARSKEEIKNVISEAMAVDGIVAFTLVSSELSHIINREGKKSGVPTIDVLGPLLSRFTDYLEISPMAIPGIFRQLDKDYYHRIECIDFAVKHDDGRKIEEISNAEVILVGPSRTSKTPISIYLAYRDYSVANIPLIYNYSVPNELFSVDKSKVIGLFVTPNRLKTIREVRASRYPHIGLDNYTNIKIIRQEIDYCKKIYRENKWDIIDVTAKSIEEAATEIMRSIGKKG